MNPITVRNAFEHGLHALEQRNDPELLEAYRRYMQHLEQLLGKDKMDAYAHVYQEDPRQLNREQVVGRVLTPEEQTLHDTVAADPEVHVLYDQYIALLKTHGLIDPKFDENEISDERRHF